MLDAAWAGILAGYGIAIPVGPIAVLILETGIHRGLRPAAAAGAGAATADLVYASGAALAGATLATILAPALFPLRLTGAALLAFLGVRGLLVASRMGDGQSATTSTRSVAATYLAFLGLTITNLITFLYFAALVLGLPALAGGTGNRVVFAVCAGTASLSWQLLLAVAGSRLHGRLSPRVRQGTRIFGSLIVLAFAAWIAWGALSA